jgi:uncharacterized protein (TIGR04255 family)
MNRPARFDIDVDRHFPPLAHAPIVEAVIHWQASPTKSLDRQKWKQELARRFPGYSLDDQKQFEFEAALSALTEGVETQQRTRWDGFRLSSTDGKFVCQLRPNGVVFSRLAPYEGWPTFVAEALRFWDSFVELAAPVAVDRLGVRFINQIEIKNEDAVSDLVNETADVLEPIELPTERYFREDTVDVPGHPYRVNLVRATQELRPTSLPKKSLIVDVDAFSTEPTGTDKAVVERLLAELRFLKNLVFFTYVKEPEMRFRGNSRW